MPTVIVEVKAHARHRANARVVAAEIAAALSSIGLDVTLSSGIEWPKLHCHGREEAAARFDQLRHLAAEGLEFVVEVAR